MTDLLSSVSAMPVLTVALAFLALYPIAMAVVWVVTSLMYALRREVGDDGSFYAIPDDNLLSVSIIVPAYEEELVLDSTLEALHHLDYPDYEVMVVDDASGDRTSEIARAHLACDPRFRLLRKEVNEGKAMAMNDAMPLTRGEVVVIVDADARLHRDALRPIVAHFVRLPRVGAVTGNPRVANRLNLLTELQTLEFTSIVSILRRAQVVWGRILTVSGVISAFRRSALEDVGLFDPSMATEDIDVSWRLQRRFYDIRYEPRALIDMTVPATWKALWRQRRRWSTGLVQVLLRHRGVLAHWRNRRHWPVFLETCLSVLWAHVFVVLLGFWALCLVSGLPARGASPFPNAWGMLISTLCLMQLATGVWLDHRYDRSVARALLVAPLYPLGYWLFSSLVTVRSTIPALLRRRRNEVAQWRTVREPVNVPTPPPEERRPAAA